MHFDPTFHQGKGELLLPGKGTISSGDVSSAVNGFLSKLVFLLLEHFPHPNSRSDLQRRQMAPALPSVVSIYKNTLKM